MLVEIPELEEVQKPAHLFHLLILSCCGVDCKRFWREIAGRNENRLKSALKSAPMQGFSLAATFSFTRQTTECSDLQGDC
jgi:hypothetical protein